MLQISLSRGSSACGYWDSDLAQNGSRGTGSGTRLCILRAEFVHVGNGFLQGRGRAEPFD